MKKFLLIAIFLLTISTLSACTTDSIEVINTPTNKVSLNIPDPAPVNLSPIKFNVITPLNSQEKFKENNNNAFMAIKPSDYEILSKDIEKIQAYITEQKAILIQYRSYYEPKIIVDNKVKK